MSELPSAHIGGWRHHEIQGEPVDTAGLPFSEAFIDTTFPAVLPSESSIPVDEVPDIPLGKVSDNHGRSYEMQLGRLTSEGAFQQTALWQDKYGNAYTALSTKGNNFTKPGVTDSLTAPSGYIPFGLQEDDALLRVLRASRLLREANIDTEWIVRVIEPKHLVFDGEPVEQAQYKKLLAEKLLAEGEDIEKSSKAIAAISNMVFYTTVRAMEISDRPWDFFRDENAASVQRRLDKVFAVYNQTHTEDDKFKPLDSNKPQDVLLYFTEVLPTLVGTNLARLHATGLVHTFPVVGNVHALGGLVDLDSVAGEPLGLGDTPVNLDAFVNDLTQMVEREYESFTDLYDHIASTGLVPDDFKFSVSLTRNLLRSYLTESNLLPVTEETAEAVLRISSCGPIWTHLNPEMAHAFVELFDMHPPTKVAFKEFLGLVNQAALDTLDSIEEGLFRRVDERLSELSSLNGLSEEMYYEIYEDAFDYAVECHGRAGFMRLPELSVDAFKQGALKRWLDRTGFSVGLKDNLAKISFMLYSLDKGYDKGSAKINRISKEAKGRALTNYHENVDETPFSHKTATAFDWMIDEVESPWLVNNGKYITATSEITLDDIITGVALSPSIQAVHLEATKLKLQVVHHNIDEVPLQPRAIFTDGKVSKILSNTFDHRLKNILIRGEDISFHAWLSDPDKNDKVYLVVTSSLSEAEFNERLEARRKIERFGPAIQSMLKGHL